MGGLSSWLGTAADLPRFWVWVGLGARSLIAAFFVFLAWKNLSGDPQMVADFSRWGYPDWFRKATAWMQIAGALLLIPTATCFYGGAWLAVILLGALVTHLLHDPLVASASPLVFLVLLVATTIWFRPPWLS